MRLTNSAFISSDITGTGDGGNITIDATESVVVDGEKNNRGPSNISSGIGFKGAEGNAGDIKITTGSLRLTNGASILSETFGVGNGGNITIDATESVVVDGESSSPVPSRISSDSNGAANFGELEINTNSLRLTNGGQITANNSGLANEGSIRINATESVIIDGKTSVGGASRISSNVERGSKAGNITITTSLLQLIDGGFITTDAANNVAELGSGEAGEILIDADIVLLGEDSTITTESITEGNAGNIILNASDTLVLENASITSNSSESAGGEITIAAGDIRLRGDSDIVTFVNNGVDNGGDITITADSVIAFDDSDIFAFAQDGTGGNINLDTPVFFGENFTSNSLTGNPDFLDNNSRADLNATGSVSGTVSVPDVSFIQNSLSELPDNSLDTDELLANSCVVPIGNRKQGRFIITGGESLPVRPGDSLPSKYPTGEVRNLPDNNNSWQPGDRIVEPQGVYRLTNGKLVLSRKCL
ncbi:Filamentous hemagglutinin family N-terminal domain protein (fragment) [Hyella patelloides LEGE 07179]|uniref:Filamentous hemagglutinin family N-terminal domain protein n=1 Tax=Hyella patelloides LEGE 07179 TaxID=945734 RepID=A0A563VV64_9CYAN